MHKLIITLLCAVWSMAVAAQTVTVDRVTRHVGAGTGRVIDTHPDTAACRAAVAASAPDGAHMCKEWLTKTTPPTTAPEPEPPPAAQPPMPTEPAGWRVPATSYRVEAVIAAIRAHAGYGSQFVAGTNPNAPTGLALPTPPRATCLANVVTVTSLAQFNTEAAGSCKRIVLAPGAHSGSASITGQDIEAVFTGATITPGGDTFALQVVGDAARVRTIGGTFNNAYTVGGWRRVNNAPARNYVSDIHIYGGNFTGLYTQGLSSTYYGDGVTISAHRLLVERVSVRAANGAFFVEPASSNIILANSNIVVPKLARHENPVRINGGDLIAILDTRLRTELGPGQTGPIKHTWRMHSAEEGSGYPGGRIIVRNVQSEGGGSMGQYPGVEGPQRQSTYVVVHGWRYYRAPEVEGNNVASFPHRNTYTGSAYFGTVMNAAIWADDNVVFFDGQSGSIFGSNVPPGPVTNSAFAPYQPAPAWSFR